MHLTVNQYCYPNLTQISTDIIIFNGYMYTQLLDIVVILVIVPVRMQRHRTQTRTQTVEDRNHNSSQKGGITQHQVSSTYHQLWEWPTVQQQPQQHHYRQWCQKWDSGELRLLRRDKVAIYKICLVQCYSHLFKRL